MLMETVRVSKWVGDIQCGMNNLEIGRLCNFSASESSITRHSATANVLDE